MNKERSNAGQGGAEWGGLGGGLGHLGLRVGVPGDPAAGPEVHPLAVDGHGTDGQARGRGVS